MASMKPTMPIIPIPSPTPMLILNLTIWQPEPSQCPRSLVEITLMSPRMSFGPEHLRQMHKIKGYFFPAMYTNNVPFRAQAGKCRPHSELLLRFRFAGDDPIISIPFVRNGEVSAGTQGSVGTVGSVTTGYLGLSFGQGVEMEYKFPWIFDKNHPCTGGLTVDLGGLPDSRVEEPQKLTLNTSIMNHPSCFQVHVQDSDTEGLFLSSRGGRITWQMTWPRQWNGVTKKFIHLQLPNAEVNYLGDHIAMFQDVAADFAAGPPVPPRYYCPTHRPNR